MLKMNQIKMEHLLYLVNYIEKQETIIQPPKRVGWVWYIGVDAGIGVHVDIPTKNLGWGPQFGIHGGIGIGGTIK